ncbi:hypothetical protein HPB47_023410 [Ixodes persulcatus]|uniref:Uncharacterized protein n=1 Tax=Ixodes persulcatus TaxID=34615 RepID=A0AC60Q9E0_IXOPE|nr:hypothetical protein HPB47_023410 [Ixodes persulcatus]
MEGAKNHLWDTMNGQNLVVIHAWLNDVLQGREQNLGRQIEAGVRKLRAAAEGVQIVMCTISEIQGQSVKTERKVVRANAVIRGLGRELGYEVTDINREVYQPASASPFVADGIHYREHTGRRVGRRIGCTVSMTNQSKEIQRMNCHQNRPYYQPQQGCILSPSRRFRIFLFKPRLGTGPLQVESNQRRSLLRHAARERLLVGRLQRRKSFIKVLVLWRPVERKQVLRTIREPSVVKVDKAQLLEAARKNMQAMLQRGVVAKGLPVAAAAAVNATVKVVAAAVAAAAADPSSSLAATLAVSSTPPSTSMAPAAMPVTMAEAAAAAALPSARVSSEEQPKSRSPWLL